MVGTKTWMLGAALVAGGLGLATAQAKAAEFGVYVGAPAYVPPCPGPGYQWIAGYYADGYWVPGRWALAGGPIMGYGYDGYYHRDWDRDREWHRDWGHDRGWHRGWEHEGFRR